MQGSKKAGNLSWRILIFSLWGLAIGTGTLYAMKLDAAPGAAGQAKVTQIQTNTMPLLVLALHSQCPCSLATVDNLAELAAEMPNRLRVLAVITGPNSHDCPVLKALQSVPNVQVKFLSESEILTQYGARTSGQAYLYNQKGQLVFSGGLTSSRGEVNDAAGIDAIRNVLEGKPAIKSTPVFGCALQTPGEEK